MRQQFLKTAYPLSFLQKNIQSIKQANNRFMHDKNGYKYTEKEILNWLTSFDDFFQKSRANNKGAAIPLPYTVITTRDSNEMMNLTLQGAREIYIVKFNGVMQYLIWEFCYNLDLCLRAWAQWNTFTSCHILPFYTKGGQLLQYLFHLSVSLGFSDYL